MLRPDSGHTRELEFAENTLVENSRGSFPLDGSSAEA